MAGFHPNFNVSLPLGSGLLGESLGNLQVNLAPESGGPVSIASTTRALSRALGLLDLVVSTESVNGQLVQQVITPQAVFVLANRAEGGMTAKVYMRSSLPQLSEDGTATIPQSAQPVTDLIFEDATRTLSSGNTQQGTLAHGTYLGKSYECFFASDVQQGIGYTSTSIENGLRTDIVETLMPDNSDLDGLLRVQQVTVWQGDGTSASPYWTQIDSKTREYKTLCDGTDVMTAETQMTANGEPQTTYYTYDEDSTIGGLMLNPSFKKVKSVVKPDGSWTKYEYDIRGRMWRTYRPWLDTPASPELATDTNCVVEETLYEANATGIATEIEWGTVSTVQGIEVARQFKSMSYSADTAVETTTTTRKTNGAGNQVITYGVETKNIYSINIAGKRTLIASSDGSGTTFYLHDNGTWNESTRTFAPSATGRDQRSRTIGPCEGTNAVAGNTRINTTVTNDAGSLLMSKSEIAKTAQPWASASYALEDGKLYTYDPLFRLIRVRTFKEQTLETITYSEGYRTVTSAEGISTVEQLNLNVQSTASARLEIPNLGTRSFELPTMIRATSTASAGIGLRSMVSVMVWHTPGVYAWNKHVRALYKQVSDLTGRLWSSVDEIGGTTTYSYSNQGRTVHSIGPEGVVVSAAYRDGRTFYRAQGGMQEFIHYSITQDGLIEETVYVGTDLGPRWTRRTTDWAGSVVMESSPSPDGGSLPGVTRYFHDGAGRVVRVERPGMAPTITVYDTVGNIWRTGLDVDGGGLSPASNDVLTENTTTVSTDADGRHWIRRETRRYVLPGSSEVQTSSTSSLLGAAPASRTLTETFDRVLIDETIEPLAGDVGMHKKKVITFSDSPPGSSGSTEETWSVDGLVYKVIGPNGQQSFDYNPEGQMTRKIGPDGTMEWHYDYKGQLSVEKNANGFWRSHSYDENTRLPKKVTYSDGAETQFSYDSAGRVIEQSGTASEHIAYEYEPDGQLKLMKTWRSEDSPPDITRWHYSPATGRLVSKEDASHRHTSFTYDSGGRLASRTDARQITTTWHYDVIGNMVSTTYSDQTPSVTVSYDRLGRQLTVSDGSGSRTATYAGQSLNLSQWQYSVETPGLLPGVRVARSEVAAGGFGGRRQTLAVSGPGWTSPLLTLGYDSLNLLASAATSTLSASFGGPPGRQPSVSYSRPTAFYGDVEVNREFTNGSPTSVTLKSRAWSSWTGWTIHEKFDSSLDLRGRRKQSQWGVPSSAAGVKTWKYGYDLRGQVTSAELVGQPGGKWSYRYDGMGNRVDATVGAVQPPPDQWTTGYITNELNQYTDISHPSPLERVILGLSNPQAQVTVKLSTDPESPLSANFSTFRFPNQDSASFVSGPQLDNSSGPMWRFATVEALRPGAATNGQDLKMKTGGWLYFPPASETLLYDTNGNLIEDGRWLYHWDAENRLIQMEEKGYSTAANRPPPLRLSFGYDSGSRRIRKTVESYHPGASAEPSGSWDLVSDTRFVYEGWNLVAELDMNPQTSSLTLKRSYVWGRDISGSEQGAGGVGGLLWIESEDGQFLPTYDANGNIMAYYRLAAPGSTGPSLSKVTERSYDAFGRNLTSTLTSSFDQELPFGFSTKYTDSETSLVYYGLRYYSPETGRWASRDPIEEGDGPNLYAMVHNNPVNRVDILGLATIHVLFRSDGTGGNPRQMANEQIDGLREMVGYCPAVLGDPNWIIPEIASHYPSPGIQALPQGDYDLKGRIAKLKPTTNSPDPWPSEIAAVTKQWEKDLFTEVSSNYAIGSDNWTPTVPVIGPLVRVIATGGGRTNWAPSARSSIFNKVEGFYASLSGDIFLNTSASKYVLAHELGHRVKWQDAQGNPHSSTAGNLMGWNHSKGVKPDCQWCEKIKLLEQ